MIKIKTYQYIYKKYFIIFSILFLSGCGNYEPDDSIREFIRESKNINPVPITPIKPLPNFEPFKLNLTELKSPFGLPTDFNTASLQNDRVRPDENRPRGPLEYKDLNQFIMIGTIERNNQIWGIIKDNNELVYLIGVQEYIGKNSGQVQTINEESIVIKELVADGLGGWQEQFISLFLENGASNAR